MKNYVVRNALYAIVIISALAWLLLASVRGQNLSEPLGFLGLLPQVVLIDSIIIGFFIKWGWKFGVFRGWLVRFPDISGTWIGGIYSDWEPEPGKKLDPIPTMLTINQSFFHISCAMHTGEMKSRSFCEGFEVEPDKQINQFSYIYTSKPDIDVSDRSNSHDGAAVFNILNSTKDRTLDGRYWTERKTTGKIKLQFYCKSIFEKIPRDIDYHPMSSS